MTTKTLVLPLAALLVAGLGTAQAASERVEVQGHMLRAPAAATLAELRGSYTLEDGRVLDVALRGRQLQVSLDGGPAQAAVAQSDTRLQTVDGRLQMDFRAAANGNVDQVRLSVLAPAEPAAPVARLALR